MRVIAGELRGRHLKAPPGEGTRPMLDRVRESLFATLQPWIEGAFVLDLFAGSGALGIEALSRGARRVRFVEKSARACLCLAENVTELDLDDAIELVRSDAREAPSWGERPPDIVFFDPPYPLLDSLRSRRALFQAMDELVRKHLAPEGVLVFHAPHRLVTPNEFAPDLVVRERVYGTNSLWYVQRDEPAAPSRPRSERSERAMSERSGLLLLERALVPGSVQFDGARIVSVQRLASVPAGSPIVAPGLIDLHVHGYAGCGPEDDLGGLARALAAAGTTAFLPTLFPDEPARLGRLAESIWKRRDELGQGARVLGLHLEGPFVNPARAGGLPADRLHAPSPAALKALLGSSSADGRGIRQVTLAPELAGAPELVAELVHLGVRVSLGHSVATAAEAAKAADRGARGATHLFNAMGGLHHREATLASFALAYDALVAEIIGDLVHVGPEAFRIALRARGPLGLALVSDALRGASLPEAEFESHGRRCRIKDGAIWLVPDDPATPPRLTGAEASQLEAVRRLVRAGVVEPAVALTMASESPARALGLEHELGRLVPGARADLLVLEPRTLTLREVLIGGETLAPV